MKHKYFRFVVLFLTMVSFSVIQEKRAEAGLVFLFGGISVASDSGPALVKVAGGLGAVVGFVSMGIGISVEGVPPLLRIPLILLDTEKSLSSETLVQSLYLKYPFIDNAEVLLGLANVINGEYAKVQNRGKLMINVSLNSDEIRRTLEPASLSYDEVNQIVSDFN